MKSASLTTHRLGLQFAFYFGMRSLLIALSVISIFILGYWVKTLRHENVRLESRVGKMESQVADNGREISNTARVQNQLVYEKQKLDGLRQRLNEIAQLGAQPPTGSYDAHISDLTSRISALETQLRTLASDSQALQTNAQAFQQGLQAQAAAAQVQAQAQQAQMQAQAEQAQLNDERTNLQNQLGDLRADLNFWRNLRDAPAEQPARVRDLELQIANQESRLRELDNQTRTR